MIVFVLLGSTTAKHKWIWKLLLKSRHSLTESPLQLERTTFFFGMFRRSSAFVLIVFLYISSISDGFRGSFRNSQRLISRYEVTKMSSGKSNDGEDALSRRRKRRGKEDATPAATPDVPSVPAAAVVKSKQLTYTPSSNTREADAAVLNQDGSSSLEDLFGLGSNQLRELMEQELPVPREDLITKKEVTDSNSDKNKVFKLPDLSEFMDSATGSTGSQQRKPVDLEQQKVDRSNREEYLRVLQLNPFADADDTMFLDEYDILPAIFGSGKLCGIPVPYLQTGHGILLTVSLLAALVYAPGNPLTEFPPEIRAFIREGLVVTYSINVVLAVQAFFNARSKNLPAIFWTLKTFLLGGIAYYEITQAKDPSKLNEPTVDPSDRKSLRNKK